MITSPVQHHDENEDEDIDMLRKIAMESLKRSRENDFSEDQSQPNHQFQNIQQMYGNQPDLKAFEIDIPFQNNAFPPTRPPRIPGHQNMYGRPRFYNNFHPRNQARPFMGHRMPQQFVPQPVIPDFVPIPHVNPQFLAQHQPPPQIFPTNNEFSMDYVPTPSVRLSPRSLEFIEANKIAMMKASTKRYSRSPPRRRRSNSRSPVRRRSRTRSPLYKRKSPEVNRKRYRSKSPDNRVYKSRNNSPKVEKRSKSPQNRSQSPRNVRFSRRGKDSRYNGNGRYNRKRSESDKEDDKNERKRSQSKPKEDAAPAKEKIESEQKKQDVQKNEKCVENKSLTPPLEPEKSTTPPLLQHPEKKEKTLEELEDELLASTDEEEGLDINMDDNELDFLNDDSESENEGRFKSKPSSNVKPTSLPSKGSYSSKSYDKSKSSYSSRNDYKRDDRYSSKRKNHVNRKNSPETYESRPRKSPVERKPITVSKDKAESKSNTESEKRPLFMSTFKSIDSGEKKAESTATKKSESRVTLVRSFVGKPEIVAEKKTLTSSVKSVITTSSEDSASKTGKKKIMERLGEFVGTKGKNDGNRSRATKQVIERRKIILEMKINQAVESKNMASRNTYVAI